MTRRLHVSLRVGLPVFALAMIGVAAIAQDQAATVLRWKFEKGKTLHYVMNQKTLTRANLNGQAMETTQDLVIDMDWEIREVSSDGVAKLAQVIKHVKFKLDSPFADLDFDSGQDKPLEGPMGVLGPVLKGMVDQPVEMTITNRGDIQDVKIPPAMLEALKQAGPAAQAAGAMFSEEGFRKMMSQSMLKFPEAAVSAGTSWDDRTDMALGNFGSMQITRKYTYTGAPATAGPAVIDVEAQVQLTVKEDAPVEITLDKQESDGKISFDRDQGVIQSSEITQKLEMSVRVQNQQIKQDVESSAQMKLQPEASPGQ